MDRRHFIATFGAAAAATIAAPVLPAAAAAPPLVVAELFTSQGCSSCPPADALMTSLSAMRPELLLLAYHVTYWDRLGWRDPYALEAATQRQRQYARLLSLDSIYTPQLVIGGKIDAIGSDRAAVLAGLMRAAAMGARPALTARRIGAMVAVDTPAPATVPASAQLLLIGYDGQRRTAVGRGENAGATLVESSIVRSIVPMAGSQATAGTGEQHAVLLQDASGAILSAVRV